jgi:hypothetical protein
VKEIMKSQIDFLVSRMEANRKVFREEMRAIFEANIGKTESPDLKANP